jgi:hypothetical protein
MKKVYLAGPMDYVTSDQQNNWRLKATKELSDCFVVLNPCRRPHGCDLNAKEIFKLDIEDVTDSQLLLVDCRNHGVTTFGTPCEIYEASYNQHKPVIGWYDEDNPPSSKGIFQQVLIDRMFDSLDKAVLHLRQYYG